MGLAVPCELHFVQRLVGDWPAPRIVWNKVMACNNFGIPLIQQVGEPLIIRFGGKQQPSLSPKNDADNSMVWQLHNCGTYGRNETEGFSKTASNQLYK